MKLKIVQQNQDNNRDPEERSMKEEAVDAANTVDDSAKENSSQQEPSPVSGSHPMLVSGKRKRKPKELIDEVSPIFSRKKKKAPSSGHKNGPDSDGTLTSKQDAITGGSSTPVQMKSPTLIRAEEFQANLGDEHPTFLKALVRSHVGSCFWMGLPVPWCKQHLPTEDTTAVLENENGEEFQIKYIGHKTGLSAGWRKFVAGNKLLEGDVLIFQLTGVCRFKVYIIRANDLNEVDGALSLLTLESQTKQNEADGKAEAKDKKKRRPKSLPLTVVQKKKQKDGRLSLGLEEQGSEQRENSGNDSDGVASEVLEGTKSCGPSFHFKNVKSFEEFRVVVNGVCIDSELPEHIRRKYYELCCSKNAFLHDRLLPGLYTKLASAMIFEMVTTADGIRGCKLTTSRKEFDVWDKSLRSFELLGLNVGFLRARLRRLLSMVFDSEGASDARRYWDAKNDLSRVGEEIRSLEAKLDELRELSGKFDGEILNLKPKAESFELSFQEEVNAPW